MMVQAKVHYYVACPGCTEKSHRADQLPLGQQTTWSCNVCQQEFHIKRISELDFETELTGEKNTPVSVTLRSITEPVITLRLNTWKWKHSREDTPEDYAEHLRYFYDQHTCPTNWFRDVEEIEFEKDTDPHGVFQFVSVAEGHFIP